MPRIAGVKDSIVTIKGEFPYVQNQVFILSKSAKGFVISASENEAKLLLIGNASTIEIQNKVDLCEDSISEIELKNSFFSKVISPWGEVLIESIDNISQSKTGKKDLLGKGSLNNKAPFLLDRIKLTRPLKTGILAIDTMIPIGLGQRELIIGDRQTGKTTIALNTIINQKGTNIKCIYVSIGQKTNSITASYQILKDNDVLNQTIIIFANPDSPAQQMLAPQVAMAFAEILAYQGEDVLVVLDDLTKHANVYREIALSIGKSPGRESYPPDIFHQHARLLERAGQFNEKYQNGSITCLPIVETIQGDIASSIPSNIISITDGQIFTSSDMFNNGLYPAINIGLSVSRTGQAVQSEAMQNLAFGLKAKYTNLAETKKFTDIAIDISEDLKKQIAKWRGINNLLVQFGHRGYSETEIALLINLFELDLLNEINNPINFSLAFQKFCQEDPGAKLIIKAWENKEINDFLTWQNNLKIVFGPLTGVASGKLDQIVSLQEYRYYYGGDWDGEN